MEQAKCTSCLWLLEKPDTEEYRCRHGRFDKKNPRWFAPSGITRPNETVAEAQKDCPFYQSRESVPNTKTRNIVTINER